MPLTIGRDNSASPRSSQMPIRTANSPIDGRRRGAGRLLVAVVGPEVLPGQPGDQSLEAMIETLGGRRLAHALEMQPPALAAGQPLTDRKHHRGAGLGGEPLG